MNTLDFLLGQYIFAFYIHHLFIYGINHFLSWMNDIHEFLVQCNFISSHLYMGTGFTYVTIYPFSKASCYKTEAKLTFKYKIQFGFWPLELADSSCKIDGTSA